MPQPLSVAYAGRLSTWNVTTQSSMPDSQIEITISRHIRHTRVIDGKIYPAGGTVNIKLGELIPDGLYANEVTGWSLDLSGVSKYSGDSGGIFWNAISSGFANPTIDVQGGNLNFTVNITQFIPLFINGTSPNLPTYLKLSNTIKINASLDHASMGATQRITLFGDIGKGPMPPSNVQIL